MGRADPVGLTLVLVTYTLGARLGSVKWILGQGFDAFRMPHWSLAVTKKEIVKTISDEIGLTQLKTKEIVQKTFDAIVGTLVRDGRIELRNFGVFEVRTRAPRKARNPRTGEKVFVPAKNVVTFKPGKEMEERVRSLIGTYAPMGEEEDQPDRPTTSVAVAAEAPIPAAPPPPLGQPGSDVPPSGSSATDVS